MLHQQCMDPDDASVVLHVCHASPLNSCWLDRFFIAAMKDRQKATLSWVCQHSTAQHSTAQHSTAQHSTAQHGTRQYVAARVIDVQLNGMQTLPLPHASKPSQMPAMRQRTLSSSTGSLGFTAGLSSCTSSVPESWSTVSVVPSFALHVTCTLA